MHAEQEPWEEEHCVHALVLAALVEEQHQPPLHESEAQWDPEEQEVPADFSL